ncbi:MAG TPA: choice-of-anchor Q domain-containing protein, partial [Clostridia bacterium]|nr:choice-of-anchor Q domain-containing protein [Clostridia bacterium]
ALNKSSWMPGNGHAVLNCGQFFSRNCIFYGDDATGDFDGTLISGGFNLIGRTNACVITGNPVGNIYGKDPALGPFGDYGGPTPTMPLLAGSVAIDAVLSTNHLLVDQRGRVRPYGGSCDIGAFELSPPPPYLWNTLQLEGMFNRVAHLTYAGSSGDRVRILASSNLVDWRAISTNTVPAIFLVDVWDTNTQSRCFYRSESESFERVVLRATSGTLTPPFIRTNGYILQPIDTGLNNSGRAVYNFTTTNSAGRYIVLTLANARHEGANSIYFNIDAEPTDPYMIWDIPLTTGFTEQPAAWRGNGTFNNNEFVPKVFILNPGAHQLIIRGREPNTALESLTIQRIEGWR